jgi:ABC-2 type transport system ATP-binding protein
MGLEVSRTRDGALIVDASAEAVGRVAAAEAIVLTELTAADSGGLEQLFLTLTSTPREEVAA